MQSVLTPITNLFPEASQSDAPMNKFIEGHGLQSLVPKVDPHYVFPREALIDLYYFNETLPRSVFVGFKAMGLPGTGKTSSIEQYFARLNQPLIRLTAKPETETSTLLGKFILGPNQTMNWLDGHLTKGVRHGIPVLVNEWNLYDSNCRKALNDLLEGKPLSIDDSGEIVEPHPLFRLFVTQNDEDDDSSTKERFFNHRANYMPKSQEIQMVTNHLKLYMTQDKVDQSIVDAVAANMVEVGTKVRAMFYGVNESANALEDTLSPRALVHWAHIFGAFYGQFNVPSEHASLEKAFTLSCSKVVRMAIHEQVTAVFSSPYNPSI